MCCDRVGNVRESVQSNPVSMFYVAYVNNLYEVLDRLRKKFAYLQAQHFQDSSPIL